MSNDQIALAFELKSIGFYNREVARIFGMNDHQLVMKLAKAKREGMK